MIDTNTRHAEDQKVKHTSCSTTVTSRQLAPRPPNTLTRLLLKPAKGPTCQHMHKTMYQRGKRDPSSLHPEVEKNRKRVYFLPFLLAFL